MLLPALLLLAVPSQAAPLPDCVHVSTASAEVQPSLEALQDCQARARKRLEDAAAARGKPMSAAKLERLEDHQRAEVKAFMEQVGVIDFSKSGPPAKDDRAPEGLDMNDLKARVKAAAGDGSKGITPEVGRMMLEAISKQQGAASSDMQGLLDAVTRDGGKLTPETMQKLQGAAKSAKGQGMDLGLAPGIEKQLLDSDFGGADRPAPALPAGL